MVFAEYIDPYILANFQPEAVNEAVMDEDED
jgi:hypothetical protein